VPAGTQTRVTKEDPDINLVKAGFAANAGAQPIDRLFAACKVGQGGSRASCSRGMQSMIAGSLGVARTDPDGHGRTPALAPGRYYVVGFVPY
jgi:hypothetical protein